MKNSDGYKCIGRLKNSKIDFYLVHCNFKSLPTLRIKNVSFLCKKQLSSWNSVMQSVIQSKYLFCASANHQISFQVWINFLFLLLVLWIHPRVSLMTVKYLRVLLMWSFWASQVAQMVKNLPAMRETWVLSLGWEDPLKKGMATHSGILLSGSRWGPPAARRVSQTAAVSAFPQSASSSLTSLCLTWILLSSSITLGFFFAALSSLLTRVLSFIVHFCKVSLEFIL